MIPVKEKLLAGKEAVQYAVAYQFINGKLVWKLLKAIESCNENVAFLPMGTYPSEVFTRTSAV